ncbi:nuclear transport factor 2 family protein [Halobellus rarus]|uniref:Nuclear transport factor 2 family protein n=1 Tax=Halobellus rarus TaxID=1126237 RepID=A0ABD6CLD8_9EURY|nr:nuclear transport factor 2 family protein [Halobellus rarus]
MTDASATSTAEGRIREYYETLRDEEPLYPFFAEDQTVVKFGITEKLTGYEEIETGLREQTATTEDWTVDSRDLRVVERGDHAWFSDDVRMEWHDIDEDRGRAFDSRWSGTLERREGEESDTSAEWLFVGMHVSAVPE